MATAAMWMNIGMNYMDGFVWCTCGQRFGVYSEDQLRMHIKEGNSVTPQA